ncbi:uncharacterized protein LOC142345650 isoform X2 [Convolutriloba macropyga]|uniref:uncharacterized protein LOC142345650 isoform X2 n=1 Tax=Convolutriloba macropyga TaxID=536237 RepID=UPI003F520078
MTCANNNLGCVLTISGMAFATLTFCFVICGFARYGANYVYSQRYIEDTDHYSVIISAFAMHIIATIGVTAAIVTWGAVLFKVAFLERKMLNIVNVVVNFVAFLLLLIAATLMTAATLRLHWTLYPKYREEPKTYYDYNKPPYNDNPWWKMTNFDKLLSEKTEVAKLVKILGNTLSTVFFKVLNHKTRSSDIMQFQYNLFNSLFTLQILADFMQAENSNLNVEVYEITTTYFILLWLAFISNCISFALAIIVWGCVARNDQACCYSDEENAAPEKEQQNVLEGKVDGDRSVKSENSILDTDRDDILGIQVDDDYAEEVSIPTPTPTTPKMEDKAETQLVPEEELASAGEKEPSSHPSLVPVPLGDEPALLEQPLHEEKNQDALEVTKTEEMATDFDSEDQKRRPMDN